MKKPFTMDLQLFAEGGSNAGGEGNNGGSGSSGSDGGDNKGNKKVEFTPEQQAEFDRIISDRVNRAEKRAGKDALEARAKEMGFASVEEMESVLKAHKESKEKEKTDLEREKESKLKAEQERDAARAEAKVAKIDAAARLQAVALGVKPERVDYLLKLADLSKVDLQDGKPDAETIKTAIDAVLKELPELKGTAQGGPGPGTNPGGQGNDKPKTLGEAIAAHYKQK